MLNLYQPPAMWGVPNASPFCLKLETFLRMAEIPFEIKPADFQKAPAGKIPYIKDDNGIMGDSSLIIEYLGKKHNKDLNSHLTPSEKAISLGFQRLIEEHLYFIAIHSRWLEPDNWPRTKKAFFGFMPPVIKEIVPAIIQKKLRRDLKGQGLGRHSTEKMYSMATDDIVALSDFLAEKPYFMGDQVSLLDASAFGLLANIILVDMDSPLRTEALTHSNLKAYCERMSGYFAQ